jgi:ubiquinone/menaquinone biosynthesis C-methylase UbiE
MGAAVAALYVIGRRARAEGRRPEIAETDEPAVTEAWGKALRTPQLQIFRRSTARRAVAGRRQARVLDVGSGAGYLALDLAHRPEVEAVTGLDLSADMVEFARVAAEFAGARATFVQADAAEMPFADDSFDVVVSTLSLHHWRRPHQVLEEIHRVLAPGGRLYLVDLRRDVNPVFLGLMSVSTRYLVPPKIREVGEPLGSFQAAFTPTEIVLLAYKAGFSDPQVTAGPFWMTVEANR